MTGKKLITWAWVVLAAIPGCGNMNLPSGFAQQPPSTPPAQPSDSASYLGKASVKSDGAGDSTSAVEAALALTDKQAKLSDELLRTQQSKKDLEETNRKLVAQTTKLQNDLDAAQKELGECNQMLVEMKKELDSWKSNVLGFRDEMRKAQKAELDSIRKVLVVLGADVPPSAAAATQPATQPSELQARAGM
jgi:peptidoglycan hydrolase CwlO-like protein